MATQKKSTQNMAHVGRDTMNMSVEEAIAAAPLNEWTIAQINERADATYAQTQAQAENYRKMGMSVYGPRAVLFAMTQEQMRQHYLYCAALGALNHTNVDPTRYLGESPAEIAQAVVSKASGRRRGAGVRALRSKYGDEVAQRIIDQNHR